MLTARTVVSWAQTFIWAPGNRMQDPPSVQIPTCTLLNRERRVVRSQFRKYLASRIRCMALYYHLRRARLSLVVLEVLTNHKWSDCLINHRNAPCLSSATCSESSSRSWKPHHMWLVRKRISRQPCSSNSRPLSGSIDNLQAAWVIMPIRISTP